MYAYERDIQWCSIYKIYARNMVTQMSIFEMNNLLNLGFKYSATFVLISAHGNLFHTESILNVLKDVNLV